MIVVDSSAFIEYYRPGGRPEAQNAVAAAIDADLVAVNGIIQVEIVAFAPDTASRRKLSSDFRGFHWLSLEPADFELAIDIGFNLRRRGLTVPTTDLIIAASALRAGALLYHLDSHFEMISTHTALGARSLSIESPTSP